MMFVFKVLGPPVGKQRARVYRDRNTGKFKAVTPEKTRKYEQAIRSVARLLLPRGWPLNRRYRLHVGFTGRCDGDNVRKAVQDSIQGVCFHNDRQVDKGSEERLTDGPPRTEILVEVLT